jgi:uncharacterized protein (DUF342 family)
MAPSVPTRPIHKLEDDIKLLELSLSEDKHKIFLRVEPRSKHSEATIDDLVTEITRVTKLDLIERDVVRDIANDLRLGKGCEARRVAQGREAIDGRDGKIVWLARRFNSNNEGFEDREFADFFTLGLFENIEVGSEIARVYKPTQGTSGLDAQGKELPAKSGKTVSMRWDRSIELRDDPDRPAYTTAVAKVAGYIFDDGKSVAIRDTLIVPGNLDWNFGHIDFVGSVKVGADVQKGFHIKARGSIEIKGSIIGDNLISAQGSLAVGELHQGTGDHPVSVVGDYRVGIAHGVVANVGGDIFIGCEARDCTLSAALAVFVQKGSIVGGSVWCVRGLEVKVLGNEAGVTTIVELKNELEVTKEYRLLLNSIKKHQTALAALELHIGPYLNNRRRVPLLKREFRVKLTGLLEKYDAVKLSLGKLEERERGMRELKSERAEAWISVSGCVHQGVVLTSGDLRYEVKEDIRGPVTFRRPVGHTDWLLDKFKSLVR